MNSLMLLMNIEREIIKEGIAMGVLVLCLLIIYISIAFETDRRKRVSIKTGGKYFSRRRRSIKKKCLRLLNVLAFNT